MSSRKRNKIIEEFIEIYKSEPCLWRIKCKDYHDRALRDAAYAKLLAKLKESEPDAVKDTVVRKINNLRSNFRKEKKNWKPQRNLEVERTICTSQRCGTMIYLIFWETKILLVHLFQTWTTRKEF